MAAWIRKTLKSFEKFSRFLEERPLTVKFSKFCSKSYHSDTDRRVAFKFREIWPKGNRWNRALLTWFSTGSPAVATARIASKICQGQPPTMYSERFVFHPNRFTFGGVIAELANTAKTRRKMNPIFGWILATSRIIIIIIPMITVYSANSLQQNHYDTSSDSSYKCNFNSAPGSRHPLDQINHLGCWVRQSLLQPKSANAIYFKGRA